MTEFTHGTSTVRTVSFDFVIDDDLRAILRDYHDQARKALENNSFLGAVVGCGSVAEGLLTYKLTQNQTAAKDARAAEQYRNKPIEKWDLAVLIEVAHELQLLGDSVKQVCHAIREYRNLVHPYRRLSGSPRFDKALALSAFRAVDRVVEAVGGTSSPSRFRPEEMNFSWLQKGIIAGCKGPKTDDDLDFLREQGIGALVRLARETTPQKQVRAKGLRDFHEDVKDFSAPSPDQLVKIMKFIDRMRARDLSVAISCGAGYGRTGTVLACYLVWQGKPASKALKELDDKRPESAKEIRDCPQSGQRDAVVQFEKRVSRSAE